MRIVSFLLATLTVLSANATTKHVTCVSKTNGDVNLELVFLNEGGQTELQTVSFGRSDESQQGPFLNVTINTNAQPPKNAIIYDVQNDSQKRSLAVSFDVLDLKAGPLEVYTTQAIEQYNCNP
jgi:hypothetical protein